MKQPLDAGDRKFSGKTDVFAVLENRPFAFGRSSVLFKARDSKGTLVCLKSFRKTPTDALGHLAIPEFFQELDAQQKLKHPNILPVIDFGEEDASSLESKDERNAFLVYPFCTGGDLRRFMRGRSFLPFAEALEILEPIARAIDFAHSSGFIHADIKPENVLFDKEVSMPLLAEFGISKYFPFVEHMSTRLDVIAGTTSYFAPEQLADAIQSPKSDIYSFGMLAFELLTGNRPVRSDTPILRQMIAKVEESSLIRESLSRHYQTRRSKHCGPFSRLSAHNARLRQ